MGRPQTPYGGPATYLIGDVGKDIYDAPLDELPPLTRSIRESWSVHTPHPVASAPAIAALFNAIYHLETRLIAIETP